MALTSLNPASLALSGFFLLATYLTYCCWSPPNPNPSGANESLPEDRLGVGHGGIQTKRFTTLSLWVLHILVTISYPSPPAILCAKPSNLSTTLFTWSPYTIAVLSGILIAAPVRLLAFKQLGENFTFRLAKPKALVKTGLYAYVQHPSYLTNWLILTSNFALLLRLDGILGCILPNYVVRWGMWSGGFRVWPALLVLIGVLGLVGVGIRVRDEETMLKKEFEKEWEEYHRKTKRFIPGIF